MEKGRMKEKKKEKREKQRGRVGRTEMGSWGIQTGRIATLTEQTRRGKVFWVPIVKSRAWRKWMQSVDYGRHRRSANFAAGMV
ncbi:hypothetical protein [Cryobacterium glucosi]|uniref:Uncharacterized protein n=1 Tax=Cryobacterium glucosi TaxID=1259175 RepID=A0ABY2INR9_9MICO|nr:hypothetical protein [Cryobacterium glucosi]TFC19468.1 hypothetical protein E3O46_11930 [Cryobacterium glucosi]